MCIRGIAQGQDWTYIVTGALILLLLVVINPLILYQKAKKQADTHPTYQQPSYYTMKEDGIFVEIGDDTGIIEWNRIMKIRHSFGLYILYTGKQQAFVFPDEAMGSQKQEIMKYIEEHVRAARTNPVRQTQKDSGISRYAKASGEAKEEEGKEENGRVKEIRMIIQSHSADETFQLGEKIGKEAKAGQVLCLYGDLGVGKTVFTQGLAKGLGVEEAVSSPTFTIVKEYEEGRLPFYHFDVYRIGDIEEMDEIGYEDYIYGNGVCLIEWADLIQEILPDHFTRIEIRKDLEKGFDYRDIEIKEI